jgi:hypothetical protein
MVMSDNHDPIDTNAFDLSLGNPYEATRVGAYAPMVDAGERAPSVRIIWGIKRQLVN